MFTFPALPHDSVLCVVVRAQQPLAKQAVHRTGERRLPHVDPHHKKVYSVR